MTQLHNDANWPRAGAWLRGETGPGQAGSVAVLGAPVCRGSITPGHCDLAPRSIRKALDLFSTYDFEGASDVLGVNARDLGDVDVAGRTPEEAFDVVRAAVSAAIRDTDAAVLLGGDNSITLPGVLALEECGLITFDAHLDLRDTARGLTNGNPIRALLDRGFPGRRIVQIGIQSFANSAAYAKLGRDAGIRVVTAEEVHSRGIGEVVNEALESLTSESIYVDLDMDVLDRAFSPGAPGSRPGGLLPWQMRIAARLCGRSPKVRALDLVEIDPTKDIASSTSLAAASFLLSFVSGVHQRCSQLQTALR